MPDESKVPKNAIRAIVVILVTMALLAIYSNIQRSRRNKLETVIVTPLTTPASTPTSAP